MDKYFCGVDPSLKGNAVVIINDKGEVVREILISTDVECYINAEQRLLDIIDQMKPMFDYDIIYLGIEGLAYMSTSPTLFERAALLFMITTDLFLRDIDFKVIPPTTLKKFVTTDGHADKFFMMKVTKCRWEIDFKDDNLCDAYGLARMALEEYTNGKTI